MGEVTLSLAGESCGGEAAWPASIPTGLSAAVSGQHSLGLAYEHPRAYLLASLLIHTDLQLCRGPLPWIQVRALGRKQLGLWPVIPTEGLRFQVGKATVGVGTERVGLWSHLELLCHVANFIF